jgi:hypothetical protein
MSRSVFVSLAVVTLALSPTTAHAAWGPDSVLTLDVNVHHYLKWGTILPAGGGDLYVIWHWEPGTGSIGGVSRVTPEGALVFSGYLDWGTGPHAVALDGSGGLIQAFVTQNNDVAFLRTTPTGVLEPPSGPPYPAHLATSELEFQPAAATDPAGGAYIAWTGEAGYFLQRVTTAGTIAPGWSSAGRGIVRPSGPVGFAPILGPDGSGGVFMLTAEEFVHVWRVQSDTTLASGWPDTGLTLSTNPYGGSYDPPALALVAGPAGHTFAVWTEGTPTGKRIAMRSFDDAGNLDAFHEQRRPDRRAK